MGEHCLLVRQKFQEQNHLCTDCSIRFVVYSVADFSAKVPKQQHLPGMRSFLQGGYSTRFFGNS